MLKSTTPSSSDDRETPLLALQDLTPVVCALFPETATNLIRVYDPYYCRGGVVTSLVQCGFTQSLVYNEDKDCYMVQKKREVPENDILITNPPYSGKPLTYTLTYSLTYSLTHIQTYYHCQVIIYDEPFTMQVNTISLYHMVSTVCRVVE